MGTRHGHQELSLMSKKRISKAGELEKVLIYQLVNLIDLLKDLLKDQI